MRTKSIKRLEELERRAETKRPPEGYSGMHELHWWAKYGEDHNPSLHEMAIQEVAACPIWAGLEFLNHDVKLLARIRFEAQWMVEIEEQWSRGDPEYTEALSRKREALAQLLKDKLVPEAETLKAKRIAREGYDRFAVPSKEEIDAELEEER